MLLPARRAAQATLNGKSAAFVVKLVPV